MPKDILSVIIIGILIFVIIGGVIILNSYNDENNKPKKFDTNDTNFSRIYVENTTEKHIEFNSISTFGELKQIAYPQFKLGEKYYYHRWIKDPDTENTLHLPEEYDTVVEVIKIDRINKSDYYILKSQNLSVHPITFHKDENEMWRQVRTEISTTIIKKNENGTQEKKIEISDVYEYEGCIFGINKENGEISPIEIRPDCSILERMFTNWMLYIDKGARWVEKSNTSHKSTIAITETEWTVADVEKINERDCFKVIVITKQELVGRQGKKISSEIVGYWMDKEKRVLVKMEKREDGVLTEMIELKNYEKP